MALCRITIAELIKNEHSRGHQPPRFETADVNLDDVNSILTNLCKFLTTIISPHNAVYGHG
jgi:hypothetical protein